MKEKKKRIIIKSFLCFVYLIILGILLVGSFRLYQDKEEIRQFEEIESSEEYTYIEVSKMSEAFDFSKETNIGYHYVLDKDTYYIIAINENEAKSFKNIIEYTTGKREKKPDSKKVYGYPAPVKEKIKKLAIEKSKEDPLTKELQITEENYESIFSNMILDTTEEQKEEFNIVLFATLLLSFIVFILLILTIIDKDKIVDSIVEEEQEESKPKKKTKR